MTIVSSKEFVTNEDKYFNLAMTNQVFVKRNNMVFVVTSTGTKMKKRLKPDNELYRAINGDVLLERINVSLDNFFAEK